MAAEGVTGVLLAGGRSTRLGRNKAVEPLAGQPLMARAAGRLAEVCDRLVVVVAEESKASGLPIPPEAHVIADRYPGKGSLGGIFTGLEGASTEWIVAVACDMPFLNVGLLEHLLAQREGHDGVVPVIADRPEPTHAAYSRTCLGPMRDRLEKDQLKITGFFDDVRIKLVPEEEVRVLDPDLLTFFNINTQEDLDRAQVLAASGH